MNNYKKYSKVLSIIGLLLLLTGVTYSFFNYTKTSSPNNIHLGNISFSTDEVDTISLTNVFPMSKQEALNDATYTEKVTINITGDTTLSKGVEYLVTAEDVSVMVNDKRVPVTLYIENSDDLGEEDEDYWTNRGGDETIYKPLAESVLAPGEYLLVGYIAPNTNGIDGSIDIKGYIDKEKIVISDTYDGTESDEMGTTKDFARGKTVLTTTEWNSLQSGNNQLSFKVKIEANEGVWVPEETNPNAMSTLNFPNPSDIKEIYFIRETPIRMEERYEAATYKVDQTYNNEGKVLSWREDDKLYVASSGDTYLTTGYNLFGIFYNVEKIHFENVNTGRVITMANMFISLTQLKEVNAEVFDTSNVTTMDQMFLRCMELESLDLSSWDTSSITSMNSMFLYDSSLESINLDGLGGDNLQDISMLFRYCSSIKNISMKGFNFGSVNTSDPNNPFAGLTTLETIDLSNANAGNVVNMPGLLAGCSNLKTVNMDGFIFGQNISNLFANLHYLESVSMKNADGSHLTNMSNMFMGSSIPSVDLTGLGSSNLTNISSIFAGCSNLKEVNMSNFNFGNITSISRLFYNLSNLERVNLSGANTSNVTDMSYLFSSSTKLSKINLTGIDTSNVETMESMFYLTRGLTEIDLSHLDTSSVTNMRSMFASSYASSINISGLGGDNLADISSIFNDTIYLERVNMSGFNFGLISSLGYNTFGGKASLKEVNLSNAVMNNITSFSYAFDGASNIEIINLSGISNPNNITSFFGTFRYTAIKTIDLSSFNIRNNIELENMFKGCSNLETIYVNSNWDASNATGAETFSGCSSLVGGAGTVYTSGNSGHEYAHIDGGVSNPGYLTLKTS